ncbi:MAG: FkbM family methyltransferase [Verrucomicrobiota bacterium]
MPRFTFHSQQTQDEFVFSVFFPHTRNGVFVDIGAHDGVSFSNSLFFERELGWSGICVEPIPAVFQKLQKNRRCACIQACVDEKPGRVRFTRVTGYGEMLSGISSKYDPKHRERIERTIANEGGCVEEIEVEAVSPADLLRSHSIHRVDLLNIDTEGNESAILHCWPFDLAKPRVILVENNYKDTRNRDFLAKHGYRLVKTLGDDIFHLGPMSPLESMRALGFKIRKAIQRRLAKRAR